MPITSAATLREQARKAREIADQLASEAAQASAAEEAARRPKMPGVSVDVSPIVAFTKFQSGREYCYAARGFKALDGSAPRWAVTGSETRRFNWPGLLAFIGEANWPSLVVLTAAEHLLPEGAEGPVAEKMGRFGRVLGTERVADDAMVRPYHG